MKHTYYGNIVLFNNSSYPDKAFVPALRKAYEMTGCTGKVVVRITKGGARRCKGKAMPQENPKLCQLEARFFDKDGRVKDYEVSTEGGWIEFSPYNCPPIRDDNDYIAFAQGMFEIIVHEFHHIYEFQTDHIFNRDWDHNRGDAKYRRRRMNHKQRPQEIRTDRFVKDAMKMHEDNKEVNEIIIDLAMEMMEHRKKHIKNRRGWTYVWV